MKGKTNEFKWLINQFKAQAHIESDPELSRQSGMKYRTFRERKANPAGLKMFELWAIADILNLSDEEILNLVKACRN